MSELSHLGAFGAHKAPGLTAVNITGHNMIVAKGRCRDSLQRSRQQSTDKYSGGEDVISASSAEHVYIREDWFHSLHSTHPDHGKPCVMALLSITGAEVWRHVVEIQVDSNEKQLFTKDSITRTSLVTLKIADFAVLPFTADYSPPDRAVISFGSGPGSRTMQGQGEHLLMVVAPGAPCAGELHVLDGSDGVHKGSVDSLQRCTPSSRSTTTSQHLLRTCTILDTIASCAAVRVVPGCTTFHGMSCGGRSATVLSSWTPRQ